jgi:hypothetical protein
VTVEPDMPLRPRRPDVIDEMFDGEAVLIHLGSGAYYALNGPASAIWALLEEGRSPVAVAAALGADTGVVVDLAAELLAEDLVAPAEEEAAPPPAARPSIAGDPPPAIQRFTDMQDLLMLDPIHDIDLDGDGWPLAREPRP